MLVFLVVGLAIPIHYRRLTNVEWKHVGETLQKHLISWKGKLLSLGGRLVLINSILSNIGIVHDLFLSIA
jgi:hypothetical protein